MHFHPAPFRAPLRAFAVLVFPFIENRVVICDIAGRGWCIPSGRVDPGEDSLQAACRELREEAGVIPVGLQYIGCYQIVDKREIRWADCYTGRVAELVEISHKEESLAIKEVTLCELPELYHLWNELTKQVFQHAFEVVSRADKHLEQCCCPPAKASRED